MKKIRIILYIAAILLLLQKNTVFARNLTQSSDSIKLNLSKNKLDKDTILKETEPKTPQNIILQKVSINNAKLPKILSQNNKLLANQSKAKQPQTDNNSEIYQGLRMTSEIVGIIERKAFRKPQFLPFFEECFKSGVPYCDPHSSFFTKKSYGEIMDSTSGEFSGIGVSTISKDISDDWIIVTDVIEGKPADKAGIKPGDKIVEVDGEKLKGLSSDEVIAKLKGPQGSSVKVKVIRNNKLMEKDFEIKRNIIKNEVATCYHFKNSNIFYISLRLFSENAAENSTKFLKKAAASGCNGIIFDLRKNPGGILEVAVDMAGLFVKKDSLVVATKDRDGVVTGEYKTSSNPVYKTSIPLFILIDNFSASASEILAGALKHYSEEYTQEKDKSYPLMVFLLGTQTFGKGSVQEVIPISNGCAIKLTTMLYYLPDGTSIQAKGIEPDFLVKSKIISEEESKWFTAFYGSESSLKNYITQQEASGKKETVAKKEKEKEKDEKDLSWEEKFRKAMQNDTQIKTAINMINILALANKIEPQKISTRKDAIKYIKEHFLTDDEIDIKKVKD
ncbi:TPA: hypothetical protein DEO28_01865 [Candidatus Dependentiae bacterium]|nr:MAG: Peptidase, S41 family [candidate division TM6 bacterium GW2011_GWE2_31_21]KKP52981.1 MAG: Peptidase, S41 family [candidate division TM6 bacterium GW2011_GWF2_33_332]HBS47782.1 hypothetical protein [Candidatus Dependentiae bacterium]HBZ73242.1 hypothetical protein [Candidatus Dependentiae bacterium]